MAARLTTYVVVAIVAATLIAGLMVGAQRDDTDGPVDLIVFNAKVYTADGSGRMAEAVAVRGNQILRVGTDREIERLRRPQTAVLDAHGATVLPGFNDADVQFIDGGLGLDRIDLLDATSIEEIQRRIRLWAEASPDRPWVVGRGWRAESFPNGGPTRQLLDTVVPDRPAYILSADGRSAWVNSKTLGLAGITRHTESPSGGVIVKDAQSGEPTGVLRNSAAALAGKLVPPPTREERARGLRAAISAALRNGITSVHDSIAGAEDFALYEDARRAGDLNVRVYSSIAVDPAARAQDFNSLEALADKYPDDPLFKLGGARIALDGPIESYDAALLEPYAVRTSGTAGAPSIGPDDLNRLVRMLDARGWQVTTAAFGDRAVRMALDAYEHAVRSNPKPARGRRHQIEYAGIVDAVDLPRFARLGIIASLQPIQSSPSPVLAEEWARAIGPDRVSAAWPARSIADTGTRVAFATGWPGASLNPMAAIYAAVNRTTLDGMPEGGWHSAERIPLKRAIDAFTSAPAYASFDEQRKGSLKAGMLADMVVLSKDVFSAPASELATTTVAVTIFDGRIVYRRDSKSASESH